jgi:hypothetical protein
MNYKIIADSSSNIRKYEFPYECVTVPLKIGTDEKEFVDNDSLEIEDMLVIEILTRYAYNAAACENSSCKDEGVARAIDLILNSEVYSRILREQDLGMH